jgi:hypoxanthine phosphoribosyltransferase
LLSVDSFIDTGEQVQMILSYLTRTINKNEVEIIFDLLTQNGVASNRYYKTLYIKDKNYFDILHKYTKSYSYRDYPVLYNEKVKEDEIKMLDFMINRKINEIIENKYTLTDYDIYLLKNSNRYDIDN